MKKMLSTLLAIALMLSITGCGQSAGTSTSVGSSPDVSSPVQDDDNEVLRIAVGREIKALDGEYGSNVGFNPYLHVFDPLINVNGENEIVECLATEWEQLDDCSWKFTLRQGVKFHDGSDFTAADVKYTFDRIATEEPKFNYAGNWGTSWPPETEIVDDYTVIIRYQSPSPCSSCCCPALASCPRALWRLTPTSSLTV